MYTIAVRHLYLFLLLVCALPVLAAPWREFPGKAVMVYMHPGQDAHAARLVRMADHELPRLTSALGMTPSGRVAIFAYTSRGEFLGDAGLVPFLRGVSYQPSGLIRIDAGGDPGEVRRTLAHELTHSLLTQHLGINIDRLPIWVNEGLAGHLSDPVSAMDLPGVAYTLHQDGLLTLEEMDDIFRSRDDRGAAYQQSRAMVAWLEYRYPTAIPQLLQRIADGDDFPTALHDVTRLDPEAWWRQWHQSIPGYVYLFTLLASPVVYAPFAILLVIVVLLRRRHQEEPADDEDEDDEDDADEDLSSVPLLSDASSSERLPAEESPSPAVKTP